ncbi:MAG: hypothetical protein Q4B14_06595, partial [Clostridia bacterium]|nr:hypothetical protein [Clostridia bacterium]
KVELELESGIYDIYVTEITDNGEENTIITRVVVSKSSKLTSDQLTIYTDFMDVTTIILNEPTKEVSDETLKSKLTAQTSKTIQAFTCDDFDNDGKKEAFAFVGDKENDDALGELFTGELWFINDNTVKQLKSYSTMMTNMYSKINYVVEFSNRKFLCLNNLCGNYSLSEIWTVDNGQPKECNISGYGQGTVTVEHNAVALTNSAYDAVYDSSTNSYIGHTWKPYYYYWDESTRDFKEYGGVKITKEQFLNIKGASDIINTVLNGGNEIVNILYRENGMININYKNGNTYDNANLLYNEKTNTMEVLKSGFTTPRDALASSYGGTYQEEIIESIATYPKKLPEIFNNTSNQSAESTTNSTTQNKPETPKYPLEGEYDEILAKGDGYYLVSKFEESYDSAATLYGVVSDAGTWVCPLSANNEFAKAANNIQDGYSQSYHKIKYDYLGDKIFVIKNCSIILGRETIPSGYWGVYESHGGCVMVDVNGKYINSGGYIITEFKDGYAFTECGNAGLVYRLDKNGNQTKVRYVDDYFGIPSEGLVCLSYIFYDIETLTPTIDLNEYDMVTKSKDLRFKNGELYFEFKNPAGTKYHVKIDKTGKFLYDPVKMD